MIRKRGCGGKWRPEQSPVSSAEPQFSPARVHGSRCDHKQCGYEYAVGFALAPLCSQFSGIPFVILSLELFASLSILLVSVLISAVCVP